MTSLFNDDNSDDEGELKINDKYAERYNQWRGKEEYQKCKKEPLHCLCIVLLILLIGFYVQ